jgi:hypothetical protein
VTVPWKETVYNRDRLFAEVWERPLRDVAKDDAVSDVALANMCRKLRVPLPTRGYWARRAAGKGTGGRPSLDPLKPGELGERVVTKRLHACWLVRYDHGLPDPPIGSFISHTERF